MTNIFRMTEDGSLDVKYLRVCSVYRLLERKTIGRKRAEELLAQRHPPTEMKALRAALDVWHRHPIPDMLP